MIDLYQFPPGLGVPNPSPFCLKLETFLKLAELDYRNHYGADLRNAPKGKMPYVSINKQVMGDSELIIETLLVSEAESLDSWLSGEEKAMAKAWCRLCNEHLYWALVYSRWYYPKGWQHIKQVFFKPLPPIIRPIVASLLRRKVKRDLWGQGLARHTQEEVWEIADKDLKAISDFLGNKPFMMGEKPSSADASVFGVLANICFAKPETPLTVKSHQYPNLARYCHNIMQTYYDQ
ncbi:glutathione S-transferase family protein [Corallincola platygyrae]|uniref:Glutathione S-transferase family protein n=1 Tax=Corallincola platygyrae TaxID=1193278 RepID=A0ABW4XLC1_9GAMM